MQITLDLPEHVADADPERLAQRIRLAVALVLFEAGEISAGAAARFAEVDRFTFAEECMRRGIPLVDYPPEELRAELERLRQIA